LQGAIYQIYLLNTNERARILFIRGRIFINQWGEVMTKEKTEFNKHELTINILQSISVLKKEKDNPFFKSKYVDLPTILQEIKPIFFEYDCYHTQQILVGEKTTLKTQIIHNSGAILLECEAPIPVKDINNPQNWGSAITFMKRYSLTALLGIEEEDDDGNKGSKTSKTDEIMMEVLNIFLGERINKCQSSEDLKNCWEHNKKYIKKLEKESKRDYDKLITKATDRRKKFPPVVKEELTEEEKKVIEESEANLIQGGYEKYII
jgi:hypothetical protein